MNSLLVISETDSFGAFFEELAGRVGRPLRSVTSAEGTSPADGAPVVLNLVDCSADPGDLLAATLARGHKAPIVVGSEPDHRLAVELMRRGAGAYYALPSDAERLEVELRRRLQETSEAERAEQAADPRASFDFSSIIGEDPKLLQALDHVARVIPNGRTTVLITGETGTGKELVAQAIHDNGPRAGQPFVAVNCSAIPANLLESELFGHEKGAFTDARAAKPGLFELADRGTLFLDELSLLPLELQGKLLRVLETREVRRVGGARTRSIDVRVLAAANADLREMVEEGELREDLYYRLAVMLIHLPPLRQRGDDILLLVRHFLDRLATEYELPVPELRRDAVARLRAHAWPGNIRELRNAVERALLLADEGVIGPENLALDPIDREGRADAESPGAPSGLPFPLPLDELERRAAHLAVEAAEGNKSEAARMLEITRKRLYRLLDAGSTD